MKPEEGLEFRFQLCSAALLDDNLKLSRDFQQESLIILFQLRRPVCNVRLRQGMTYCDIFSSAFFTLTVT